VSSESCSQVDKNAQNVQQVQITKHVFLLCAILSWASPAWSADVYLEKASPDKHCPLRGSAKAGSTKAKENAQKNRWHAPLPNDFDNRITTQALAQPTDDPRRTPTRAARIKGYVAVVKANTEGESCNCGSKKSIDCDTHIAVVPDRDSIADRRSYVFVEVTPRIRELLTAQNPPVDWTSEALKKRLLGKRVQFEGWMFFDSQHKGVAVATHPIDPKGRNWRATCWEIHPVTSIQVLGIF
jgi:hypothetical protein